MLMINIKIVNPPVEVVTSMTTVLGLHKALMNICIKIGCFSRAPRQGTKPFISWIFFVCVIKINIVFANTYTLLFKLKFFCWMIFSYVHSFHGNITRFGTCVIVTNKQYISFLEFYFCINLKSIKNVEKKNVLTMAEISIPEHNFMRFTPHQSFNKVKL